MTRYRITIDGGLPIHRRPLAFADAQLLLLAQLGRQCMYVRSTDQYSIDPRNLVLQVHRDGSTTAWQHGVEMDATTIDGFAPWVTQFTTALERVRTEALPAHA